MSNKINIIKQTEGTVYANKGKELTLRLLVSTQDHAPYIVEWRKDGVSVPAEQIEDKTNFLYIKDFQPEQAGVYTARVKLQENQLEYVDSQPITVIRIPWIAPEDQSDTYMEKRLGEELRVFATAQVEEGYNKAVIWYKNHIQLSPDKILDDNVRVPRVGYEDFGNYTCKVFVREDARAHYWISPVVVEQNHKAPVIKLSEQYPDSITVPEDAPLELNVLVDSDNKVDPITYAWVHDGRLVPGEYTRTLHKSHVTKEDAGIWRLEVSQADTMIYSKDCKVIVGDHAFLRISKQPLTDNVPAGGVSHFSVDFVTSYPDAKIQWYKKSNTDPEFQPIVDATEKVLVVPALPTNNETKYKAKITYGRNLSVETEEASLLVGEAIAITITDQPVAIENARVGASKSLICRATSNYPHFKLDYQWYKDEVLLVGQNKEALHFSSIAKVDEGTYKCAVSTGVQNHRIIKESNSVRVSVDDSKASLTITVQPKSVKVRSGGKWLIKVEATTNDVLPLVYRWFKDGKDISNGVENLNHYGEDHAQIESSGVYTCKVIAGIGAHRNSKTTDPVNVIISDDPEVVPNDLLITKQPIDKTAKYNEQIVLHAQGTTSIGVTPHYQWYKDGQPLPGENHEALVISHVKPSDVGTYTAKISAAEQVLETDPAHVTLLPHENINIISHPVDVVAKEGKDAKDIVLEATADHVDEAKQVTYQWHRIHDGKDTIIQNATQKKYVVPKDQVSKASNEGTYYAEIKDDAGHVKQTEKIRVVFTTATIKGYVHPIPWRNTSFQWQGYWVMDEIQRCIKEGLDWLTDFEHTKYPKEVETIAAALHVYNNTHVLESRNGYLIDGTQLF